MKLKKRYLLMVAGGFSTIFGIMMSVPAILQNQYLSGSIFIALFILGIIVLAIAFGDEDEERIKKEFIGS